MRRLRDALLAAGVLLGGVLTRFPVRPHGDEDSRPLPGDEIVPDAKTQWTNGITIRGRPSEIWPWLVQMGCTRAGWYSYDGLDNGGVPSAETIVRELQRVEAGDVFPWTRTNRDGFIVRFVEADRAVVLTDPDPSSASWSLVLDPVDETKTRLIARVRVVPRTVSTRLMLRLALHPVHFVMQRKQLLNLKRRVEAAAPRAERGEPAPPSRH